METGEKAFEEWIKTLREKVLAMTEEFQEQTRSLEGKIVLLKREMVHRTPSASDPPPAKVQVLEPKSLWVVHEMPKTWRTSFGTWSNISLLPKYLLVNK